MRPTSADKVSQLMCQAVYFPAVDSFVPGEKFIGGEA